MSIFTSILSTGSPWLYAGIFATGLGTGIAVTAPIATWKERAAWTTPMDDARKEATKRETAANAAAAQQAKDFTEAVTKVNSQNEHTESMIGDFVVTTQDISHALTGIKGQLATVELGGCTFTIGADSVRLNAYGSTVRKAPGATETGKANSGDASHPRPARANPVKPPAKQGSGTDR